MTKLIAVFAVFFAFPAFAEEYSAVEGAEEYYALMTQEGASSFWGDFIFEMIDDKEVTWDELSFTKEDLKQVMHQADVLDIEKTFAALRIGRSAFFADYIRDDMRTKEIAWDELSFGEADLAIAEHGAILRGVEAEFLLISTGEAKNVVEIAARSIYKKLADGVVSWDELSFDEEAFAEAMNNARSRFE